MKARITRRSLAGLLAVTPLAAQAPPGPTTVEQDLESARTVIRTNIEALNKVPLAMDTEPATIFKA
jgi:hypothetical protein